jgi:feruloyl-CoA synthase
MCAMSDRRADRDEIAVLVFPDLEACRGLCGMPGDAARRDCSIRCRASAVCDAARQARSLQPRQLDADMPSPAARGPASLDVGEMTDKGSINQHAVQGCAALVEELYAPAPSPRVIMLEERALAP